MNSIFPIFTENLSLLLALPKGTQAVKVVTFVAIRKLNDFYGRS